MIVVSGVSFALGVVIGAAAVVKQLRTGHIKVLGRIYQCKDIGSAVR